MDADEEICQDEPGKKSGRETTGGNHIHFYLRSTQKVVRKIEQNKEKNTQRKDMVHSEGEERSSARENLSPSSPMETEEGKRAVDQSQTGDLRAEPGAKYQCAGGVSTHVGHAWTWATVAWWLQPS